MTTLAHFEDDEIPAAGFTNPRIIVICLIIGAIIDAFACYGIVRLIGG